MIKTTPLEIVALIENAAALHMAASTYLSQDSIPQFSQFGL
jgi:hypothetical protein